MSHLTLSDAGIDYRVWFDRYDGDRPQYGYSITEHNGGRILATGCDLRGGSGEQPILPNAMESLLGFLGAFLESRRYGTPQSDNWDLFPDACAEIDGDAVDIAHSWLEEENA